MNFAIRSLLMVSALIIAAQAFAAPAIQGTYRANGQDAQLKFALAKAGEPFSGNPTTQLIFTEQDASGDPQPDFHAAFGDFGSALVVRLMKDEDGYSIIGCEFGHKALKHMGASAIGIVDAKDVKVADGRITGALVSSADADIFDEPVSVDLKFDVKMP